MFPSEIASLRRRTLNASLCSVGLHVLGFCIISWSRPLPRLGFDFVLPAEVELGVTEGEEEPSPAASAETKAAEPAAPFEKPASRSPKEKSAPLDGQEASDAGATARRKRDVALDAAAGDAMAASSRDGGVEEPGADTDAGVITLPKAHLPVGAQIALWLDIVQIRNSPLAANVEALLDATPDWQALLRGSGIEPIRDLDRLLVASPNLDRSRWVMAGKHHHSDEWTRTTVERMAAEHGERAAWQERDGIPVAPWYHDDDTPRLVGILGPHHFVISRPRDLPRVLSSAHRLSIAGANAKSGIPQTSGEALLSMAPGEVLALEVQGARQFVQGDPQHVPLTARLGLRSNPQGGARAEVVAEFPSEEDAQGARLFWERITGLYANRPDIRLFGLHRPLEGAEFRVVGKRLVIQISLRESELRLILSYLAAALNPSSGSRRGLRQPP